MKNSASKRYVQLIESPSFLPRLFMLSQVGTHLLFTLVSRVEKGARVSIGRSELAEFLGFSRDEVVQGLTELEELKFIRLVSHEVVLLNPFYFWGGGVTGFNSHRRDAQFYWIGKPELIKESRTEKVSV